MENLSIDTLARRMEQLERDNRRWKCAAGVTAMGLVLSLCLGGVLGSRAVVAQQAEKNVAAAVRGLQYKVTDAIFLNQLQKPLQDLDADGWEVMQVVPHEWTSFAQGSGGYYSKGIVIARRPKVIGK